MSFFRVGLISRSMISSSILTFSRLVIRFCFFTPTVWLGQTFRRFHQQLAQPPFALAAAAAGLGEVGDFLHRGQRILLDGADILQVGDAETLAHHLALGHGQNNPGVVGKAASRASYPITWLQHLLLGQTAKGLAMSSLVDFGVL